MALKILQGKAKSLSLESPKSGTRPTSVLLRRKIFDAHQDMSGMVFIDGCAGTGAMGLEAASRGASRVILIEPSKQAFHSLKKNAQLYKQRTGEQEIHLSPQRCQKWLEQNLKNWNGPDSILFLDPPYENTEIYLEVLDILKKGPWCGDLWLESDRQKGILLSELEKPELLGKARRVYKQGTSFIAIWSFG